MLRLEVEADHGADATPRVSRKLVELLGTLVRDVQGEQELGMGKSGLHDGSARVGVGCVISRGEQASQDDTFEFQRQTGNCRNYPFDLFGVMVD